MFARCFNVCFCFCFFLADLSVLLVFPASKIMGRMTSVSMILDGFSSDGSAFCVSPCWVNVSAWELSNYLHDLRFCCSEC